MSMAHRALLRPEVTWFPCRAGSARDRKRGHLLLQLLLRAPARRAQLIQQRLLQHRLRHARAAVPRARAQEVRTDPGLQTRGYRSGTDGLVLRRYVQTRGYRPGGTEVIQTDSCSGGTYRPGVTDTEVQKWYRRTRAQEVRTDPKVQTFGLGGTYIRVLRKYVKFWGWHRRARAEEVGTGMLRTQEACRRVARSRVCDQRIRVIGCMLRMYGVRTVFVCAPEVRTYWSVIRRCRPLSGDVRPNGTPSFGNPTPIVSRMLLFVRA